VATELEQFDTAEAHYLRMAAINRRAYGERHQSTAVALANLATVYSRKNDFARAELLLKQVLATYAEVLPPEHLNTGIAQIKLGRALVRQKRFLDAEPHTLAGYRIFTNQGANPSNDYLQGARGDLALIYEALGQPEKAKTFRSEQAGASSAKESPPR
jgi:tetratricopeptide (TPR) repeat protein